MTHENGKLLTSRGRPIVVIVISYSNGQPYPNLIREVPIDEIYDLPASATTTSRISRTSASNQTLQARSKIISPSEVLLDTPY